MRDSGFFSNNRTETSAHIFMGAMAGRAAAFILVSLLFAYGEFKQFIAYHR